MMRRSLLVSLGICSLFVSNACKKKSETPPPPRQAETHTMTTISDDACAYLTKEEIQQVQGAPVKETKGSGTSDGRLRALQCYYAADPSNRSVSLVVTRNDPKSSDSKVAREAWKETFARDEKREKEDADDKEKRESLRESEEEEHKVPLKKIDGVGEEAYWVGSRVGGALYVLKGNASIRLSIGGPDNEEEKIKKTKALAEKALGRL